ncbi:MAG: orotidine-5'-phosphate decarboxylase [Butyrivibrio sp.]|nr:orotidine-5'-phosphate decarboxylase [Butyrivibrio sp.]
MISRLIDKIQRTGAPIVVGLDPKLDFIPENIKEKCFEEKGRNLEGAAEAFWQFNREIIDHIADIVPAVKPQIAMYEELGIPGLITFKKTVDYAKEKGLIVIGDVKRGDIGSTSESYAVGHLGEVTIGDNSFKLFDEDFATVNPYLGSDGVKPFINVCNKSDKGIFVLVKTSNPSSGEFQDRLIDGKPLYEIVGEHVEKWGQESMDGSYSNVGAVVGATYPEMGKVLRDIMPHAYILVPGYGAQGGKGKDLVHFFDKDGLGAIVNSSRGIIAAWKSDSYKQFADGKVGEAARTAALDMKKDISDAISLRIS